MAENQRLQNLAGKELQHHEEHRGQHKHLERSEARLKIKTVVKGSFPAIGFVKDPTGVAALYLGKREGKGLVYMGKVGTGSPARSPAKSAAARYGRQPEVEVNQAG